MADGSTQDLTVFMQAPTIFEYLAAIMQRQQAQDRTLIQLAAPRICNAATQILNHAAGQEFQETPSTRFQQMQMGADSAAIQVLSDIAGLAPRKLAQNLDNLVGRRNNEHINFTGAAALKAEVEECVGLIEDNPGLEKKYKWECFVIKNHSQFCKLFPGLQVDDDDDEIAAAHCSFVPCLLWQQGRASSIGISCYVCYCSKSAP
jgi:hypothetical protein